MLRLVLSIAFRLIANALGIIVAAVVLDDMTLTVAAFLLDVIIFTIVVIVAQPVIQKTGFKHSEALMGSSALLAGLVALVITAWMSDGLQISGAVTWVLATIIVWAVSLVAGFLLPAIFVKRAVQEARR